MDSRHLVIKEFENIIDVKSLNKITIINITPGEEKYKYDDIRKKIKRLTAKSNFDGFEIQEFYSNFEQGASSEFQQIIFAISTGLLTNVAYDIIKSLILSVRKKEYKNSEKLTINEYEEIALNEFKKYFGKNKNIILKSKLLKNSIFSCILGIKKREYKVTIHKNGKIIVIEK